MGEIATRVQDSGGSTRAEGQAEVISGGKSKTRCQSEEGQSRQSSEGNGGGEKGGTGHGKKAVVKTASR